MKLQNRYILKVITTGFVILTISSIVLFWARKTCEAVFYENLTGNSRADITIKPSGLLPVIDNDPQVVHKSSINAFIDNGAIYYSLGIIRDIRELKHGKTGDFCILRGDETKENGRLVLYDNTSGCFVLYDVFKVRRGWNRKPLLYAGPKGIGESADKNLGRFSRPHNQLWSGFVDSFVVYDASLEGFFLINFRDKIVTQGPKHPDVVQMGNFNGLDKNGEMFGPMMWLPPMKRKTPGDNERENFVSAAEEDTGPFSGRDLLILDNSGYIRRLNLKTLELSKPVRALPFVNNSGGYLSPDELFAYNVVPFTIKGEYAGTISAGVCREGWQIQVVVFDKNGKQIERKAAFIDLFGKPGGPLMVTIHYLLENLQPAFCGLASYFTASAFEAVDGHTGLFLLPNSFVGIFSRDTKDIIGPFFGVLLIISPSIVLGLLLGFLVYRNAGVMGFSKTAKRNWLIGTILFGLPGYITYKLTRPREKLVTCVNCGQMRRPDMAKCHRCGAKWHIPELIPPMWRVIIEHEKNAAG